MSRILHVDAIMYQRMQEHAAKADFYGIDPSVAALAPTGLDIHEFGSETTIVVDLETAEDRPDGQAVLE